jgi:hypothetical protein
MQRLLPWVGGRGWNMRTSFGRAALSFLVITGCAGDDVDELTLQRGTVRWHLLPRMRPGPDLPGRRVRAVIVRSSRRAAAMGAIVAGYGSPV